MNSTMQERIESMAKMDRLWGVGFVIVLWVVYAFVFVEVNSVVQNAGVRLALIIGGVVVVIFNTASITAMLRQYAKHKEATYEPDIRHLDEKRALKRLEVRVG